MALTSEDQKNIENLAVRLIEHYEFTRAPVPVDKILYTPPEGLDSVDISDMSLAFGIGEHRYEYRMALARLLYREICRASENWEQHYPYTADAARYFSSSLLVPAQWVIKAARKPFISLETLSEEFQVPEYAISSRLVLLGKRVKGM